MIPLSDAPGRRRSFPAVNILLILINIAVFVHELSLGSGLNRFFTDYGVVPAARRGPRDYCHCYNTVRYHQGLEYRTPHSVHYGAPAQSPSGVGDRRGREPGLAARPRLD